MKGGILLEHDGKYENVVKPILSSLNKEGFKSRTVQNIEGFLWSKLILNLQNPITALTGQTIKQSILNKTTRQILIATIGEGMNVADNSGIKLEKLPNINPRSILRWLNLFNSSILKIGTRLIRLNENAKNSMAQSLSRGKQTEIDFINGEIVNLAKQNNLKSPINKKLVELVKQAERKRSIKSFEPSKLMKILNL
jgi:2-dehydropantoate 2-reductase